MRHKLIYLIFALLACATATAQQMPERSLVRKGNRLFNKGEYTESISRYEEALKHAPRNFEAGINLGNALYKSEKYDAAEKQLAQVAADSLLSDADRAEAYYNLGNSQFRQKKYKEALKSYRESLLRNPSDREAKYNYAYTKRLIDDNEQNGGGGNDDQQQNQDQQNKNQNGQNDPQNGKDQKQPDKGEQDNKGDKDNQPQNPDDPRQGDKGDRPDDPRQGEGQPSETGISPQEQQQMLDAIQAQEDKTQDKLKEKRKGILIPSKKNW